MILTLFQLSNMHFEFHFFLFGKDFLQCRPYKNYRKRDQFFKVSYDLIKESAIFCLPQTFYGFLKTLRQIIPLLHIFH